MFIRVTLSQPRPQALSPVSAHCTIDPCTCLRGCKGHKIISHAREEGEPGDHEANTFILIRVHRLYISCYTFPQDAIAEGSYSCLMLKYHVGMQLATIALMNDNMYIAFTDLLVAKPQ